MAGFDSKIDSEKFTTNTGYGEGPSQPRETEYSVHEVRSYVYTTTSCLAPAFPKTAVINKSSAMRVGPLISPKKPKTA